MSNKTELSRVFRVVARDNDNKYFESIDLDEKRMMGKMLFGATDDMTRAEALVECAFGKQSSDLIFQGKEFTKAYLNSVRYYMANAYKEEYDDFVMELENQDYI